MRRPIAPPEAAPQPLFDRGPVCRHWLARRRCEEPVQPAVDDKLRPGRHDIVPADLGRAVDRDNTRSERVLSLRHTMAAEAVRRGADRKPAQGSVRLGELQTAEAGGVERRRGVGRGRMPGQRQHRAVRQVLLDLGGKCAIELPQHDADVRVGVARPQRRLEIELVVMRQGQDGHRLGNAGHFEASAAVRPAGDKLRTDRLDGAGKFQIGRPQHDDAPALQQRQFARRAERQGIAADDDHQEISVRRHARSGQPVSSAGG